MLFVMLGFSLKEEPVTDLKKMNLEGRVKSVELISYRAITENGETIKQERAIDPNDYYYFNKHFIFNENGYKMEEQWYSNDNEFSSKTTYKYDASGNMIELEEYLGDGSLENKWMYRYDNHRNQVERKGFDSDIILFAYEEYFYNKEDQLIQLDEYNPYDDGALFRRIKNKYNEKGKITESCLYNSKNMPEDKTVYRYFDNRMEWVVFDKHEAQLSKEIVVFDDKGNKLEERKFDKTNKLTSQIKNEYNEMGEIKKSTVLHFDESEKSTYKTISVFDEKGNIVEQVEHKFDIRIESKWTYKYDKSGNVAEESCACLKTNNEESKLNYTIHYEFDAHNNWIKKVKYYDDDNVFIIERTIQYFN